jgi:hypothetical protein
MDTNTMELTSASNFETEEQAKVRSLLPVNVYKLTQVGAYFRISQDHGAGKLPFAVR